MTRRTSPGSLILVLATAATLLAINLTATTEGADDVIPADPPLRWWKGNLHTHSFWSDGTDFP